MCAHASYLPNFSIYFVLGTKYGLPATFFCTAVREAGFDYLWTDFLDVCSRLTDAPVRILNVEYRKRKPTGNYRHPDGRHDGQILQAFHVRPDVFGFRPESAICRRS